MSEESNGPAKTAEAKAEKPAAEVKEAPQVEPGEAGKLLNAAKLAVTHLGPDAIGLEMIEVSRENLLEVARFLRDDANCRFDLLLSCTAVDWKEYRQSVYHLYSTVTHKYVVVKVQAGENENSPSLMPIYPAVDWHEREAYDLMGIIYDGHPDLRRILMPTDWLGHPLRKNYKVDDPRLVWNER